MGKTNISWADAVWNPITGCTKCSPGCANCYAKVMATRLKGMRQAKYRDGFDLTLHEQCLTEPLTWKKPQTIFVCSMSDLFHPGVPFAFLDKVFAVMALCPQHTFVLCTKRAERMREYLTEPGRHNSIELAAESIQRGNPVFGGKHILPGLPLKNAHFGVTVESRGQWTRIAILQATPADHRWISYEPALGCLRPSDRRPDEWTGPSAFPLDGIDGVIIGCESGPNRRPFDLEWARQVRDDCEAAEVELYVKQLIVDGKFTKKVAEFPEDLRIQQLPWDIGKRGA